MQHTQGALPPSDQSNNHRSCHGESSCPSCYFVFLYGSSSFCTAMQWTELGWRCMKSDLRNNQPTNQPPTFMATRPALGLGKQQQQGNEGSRWDLSSYLVSTLALGSQSHSDKREYQGTSCCGEGRLKLYINGREHLQWFGPKEDQMLSWCKTT